MPIRLPRFSRAATASSIEVTSRDQAILRLVHRYRFLRSSQIVIHLGGSAQQILRRLQLLYHHGYLERPRCQLDYYHRGGSHPIVYGLGDKGAKLLKRTGIAVRSERVSDKNRSLGRVYLEHVLLVSEVMIAIELACRQSGIRLLNEEELGNGHAFRWRVDVNSQVKLGIIPDRVFGLEYRNAHGATERAYFFLEADRGTMPVVRTNLNLSQTSFYRKLLSYEATWEQEIHRTLFDFHRFRVLTVTTSAARMQALVDACSQLSHGQRLFLFADRSILEHPSDILRAAWRTGRIGETATLLD